MGTYYPSHNYGPEHAAEQGGARLQQSIAGPKPQPKREISQKQLEANRRNAQKSTGPRTEEGKARVSQNACRHGITGHINISNDADRKAKEAFCQPIVNELAPQTPLETQLANSIADDYFRLNRLRAIEDNMLAYAHHTEFADIDVDNAEIHNALTEARIFLNRSKDFERLTLYAQRVHRDIDKNTARLEAMQQKRRADREQALEEAAQLSRLEDAPAVELPAPNGFVFSNEEIARWIVRRECLKEITYRERTNWDPESQYDRAA